MKETPSRKKGQGPPGKPADPPLSWQLVLRWRQQDRQLAMLRPNKWGLLRETKELIPDDMPPKQQ